MKHTLIHTRTHILSYTHIHTHARRHTHTTHGYKHMRVYIHTNVYQKEQKKKRNQQESTSPYCRRHQKAPPSHFVGTSLEHWTHARIQSNGTKSCRPCAWRDRDDIKRTPSAARQGSLVLEASALTWLISGFLSCRLVLVVGGCWPHFLMTMTNTMIMRMKALVIVIISSMLIVYNIVYNQFHCTTEKRIS